MIHNSTALNKFNSTGITICLMIFSLFFITSCKNAESNSQHAIAAGNHLKDEISPYLLQHAHNPVDWYPWKDEALELALKTRKLLIISIGYSSCHWCHVMERESFSDTAVSRIMNKDFVSIKVDREERPDIDQIYMNACQIVNSGACGWPLNAIALPDGRPVWVGTYLTKDEWMKLLVSIQEVYSEDPNELEKMAMGIQNHLSVDYSNFIGSSNQSVSSAQLNEFMSGTMKNLDMKFGGKRSSQKFPLPSLQRSMMEYAQFSGNKKAEDYVKLTLDKMMQGGIYDHLTGGFYRYTVDSIWKVPHFEKMLYDNAQLISLYAQAYQYFKKPEYRDVVAQSMNFVLENLTHPDGMFFSSLNAESEGEEGKYYVWTMNEISTILQDPTELSIVKFVFDIKADGNWENGKNILFQSRDLKSAAKELKIDLSKAQTVYLSALAKLEENRGKRVSPTRDEKALTSWNSLMIRACLEAYAALSDPIYLEAGKKAMAHIQNSMYDPGSGLKRNFMKGNKSINGFLEDYAFTIDALLRLYELTFDESYLTFARELAEIAIRDFSDDKSVYFYFTSKNDRKLISRKVDFEDQVTPSANSVMADVLHRLGLYYYHQPYMDRAKAMTNGVLEQFGSQQTEYYSNWSRISMAQIRPLYEVAIVGEKAEELRNSMIKNYLPNAILLGGKTEGSLELLKEKLQEGNTYIYVCRNKVCKLPVQEVAQALELMK
jgi:uncharacterized protein YyaL (SSP411 family)